MDIDKQIAEKVMGWTVQPESSIVHELYIDKTKGYNRDIDSWNFQLPTKDFNPSTNIADAWLVVERMRGLGFWLYIWNNGSVYWCEFGKATNDPIAKINAETAPMAICKSALKALEG